MVDPRAGNDINDRASEWAVAVALGDMAPGARADLAAWLAADRRHRGAYARASAWLRAAEDAVIGAHAATAATLVPAPPARVPGKDNRPPDDRPGPGPLRRGLFRWSGRAAAATAALAISTGALVALGFPVATRFDSAGTGDAMRVVTLRDGTVARLGTGARIRVSMADDIRKIVLLSGEARFEVASDKARPFVVRSGDVYAQATGTVYSVRRVGPTGGRVSVTEGSVLVWPRDERDQAVLLRAGGEVTLDPGPVHAAAPSARRAPPPLPPPELAQISLDNVPVRAAVARFNRVNRTRIVIADAAIGDLTIIGLYRADDPAHFAAAVAAISGGVAERNGDVIVIKLKHK